MDKRNRATGIHALFHECRNTLDWKSRKVLCVCSAGCLRSPTAASVLHTEYGYNTRSAGIEEGYAIVPVTARLLMWADEIVCMESWQAREIHEMLAQMGIQRRVVCLNIDDNYSYMQPELVELINERYEAESEKWISDNS